MNLQEAYQQLGLSQNASKDEVKKKFRTLSKTKHPDVCKDPDAAENFKKISEAYNTINNPPKQHQESSGFGGFGGFSGFSNFSDFFNPRQSRQRHVRQIVINKTISFNESVLGTSLKIEFDREKGCQQCSGQGSTSTPSNCKECDGSGVVTRIHEFNIYRQACNKCKGPTVNDCKSCNNNGFINTHTELDVNIPGGVSDGSTLRLQNAGNFVGNMHYNLIHSDVFLKISVTPEPGLTLEGKDVHSQTNITLLEALKGKTVSIKTVLGNKELMIPKHTNNGDVISIPKAGAARVGDHKVKISVDYPKDTKPLIEFLEKGEDTLK